MLRTPSACAPSSSDSSAMRFRSRVVTWTRHSRSRSCWIPNATAIAPIRTRAIAESLTLTRSVPASRRRRAASSVRSIRMLRGGSISTEITNRPSASACGEAGSAAARRLHRSAGAVGLARCAGPAPDAVARPRPRGRGAGLGRAERVEGGAHRRDVGRRRPAAAADDPRARVEQPRHDRAEVRRARPRRRTGPRGAAAGRRWA